MNIPTENGVLKPKSAISALIKSKKSNFASQFVLHNSNNGSELERREKEARRGQRERSVISYHSTKILKRWVLKLPTNCRQLQAVTALHSCALIGLGHWVLSFIHFFPFQRLSLSLSTQMPFLLFWFLRENMILLNTTFTRPFLSAQSAWKS